MGKKQKDIVRTSNQQTSQQATPFGAFAPQIGQVGSLVGQGLSGPLTAGFTPDQLQAFDLIRGQVGQGSPLLGAGTDAALGGLAFANPFTQPLGNLGLSAAGTGLGGLSSIAGQTGPNPFLGQALEQATDPLVEQFTTQIAPGLAASFSGAGRLRGGGGLPTAAADRASGQFARDLSAAQSPLLFSSTEAQAGRQLQANQQLANLGFGGLGTAGAGARGDIGTQLGAIGQLPGLDALRFADANRLFDIGSLQQQQQQNQLGAPLSAAQQGASTLFPFAQAFGTQTGSQFGQTTTPTFGPSPLAQAAGLGLSAAGLFFGGPAGAAAGSALGGALSGGTGGSAFAF